VKISKTIYKIEIIFMDRNFEINCHVHMISCCGSVAWLVLCGDLFSDAVSSLDYIALTVG
jgi:hypothetical protein